MIANACGGVDSLSLVVKKSVAHTELARYRSSTLRKSWRNYVMADRQELQLDLQ